MEQLTEVVGQIGNAVGEQYRGAEEVLGAVEVIREAVTRNQASIVQINLAAGLLDYEATSLRETVGHFKLPAPRPVAGTSTSASPRRTLRSTCSKTSTVARAELSGLIFECLVGAGRGAGVEPQLAEGWDISADGHTYTFRLRAGVRFHNGRLMTAEDVDYSFRRALRCSKSGAWVFKNLIGADEFARRVADDARVRVLDARTVELSWMSRSPSLYRCSVCLSRRLSRARRSSMTAEPLSMSARREPAPFVSSRVMMKRAASSFSARQLLG